MGVGRLLACNSPLTVQFSISLRFNPVIFLLVNAVSKLIDMLDSTMEMKPIPSGILYYN